MNVSLVWHILSVHQSQSCMIYITNTYTWTCVCAFVIAKSKAIMNSPSKAKFIDTVSEDIDHGQNVPDPVSVSVSWSIDMHGTEHGKLGCLYAVTITAMSILLLRGGNFQVLVILKWEMDYVDFCFLPNKCYHSIPSSCSKLLMHFQTEIS